MGQFNFKLTARRTMVSKLVASCSLVLIPALIWADKLVPHAVHHAPVHHAAPYAPCYQSKCTQKFVYHRMLSLDPCDPYRGFFIDTYKLPSACSCHIPA